MDRGARVLTTLARLLDPLHGVPDATRQRFEDWYRQAAIPQIRYVAFLTMGLYLIYAAIEQNVETDQPFAEPGVFVVNGDGNIQILDISNAPFARPDLEGLLNGVKFVRDNDYPIRGTHAGA